jgi:hypothetical protein
MNSYAAKYFLVSFTHYERKMKYQEFMPHWKKREKCFEDEPVGALDIHQQKIMKDGKPVTKPWPHDKPTSQIAYENWLEKVVNPETKEFYPARNRQGNPIKGTGAKHTVTQIIRFRRKDGKEFLYTLGECLGYDALGNVVDLACAKPEMWTKTLFNYERRYDERTHSTKVQTVGTLGTEEVYEMPFNEKNLKELFSLRESDNDILFILKDEVAGKPVALRREPNLNDTLKLFQKPFDYLLNAEYITPQQRAQLRQMAIDEGIIAPNTPLDSSDTNTPPPKDTYR